MCTKQKIFASGEFCNEENDVGIREEEPPGERYLVNRLQARLVVVHVVVQLAALHVEHVNQHLDVPEDVVLLRGEVLLHERLLAAAVPQVQHQVAEEADVRVLDVD